MNADRNSRQGRMQRIESGSVQRNAGCVSGITLSTAKLILRNPSKNYRGFAFLAALILSPMPLIQTLRRALQNAVSCAPMKCAKLNAMLSAVFLGETVRNAERVFLLQSIRPTFRFSVRQNAAENRITVFFWSGILSELSRTASRVIVGAGPAITPQHLSAMAIGAAPAAQQKDCMSIIAMVLEKLSHPIMRSAIYKLFAGSAISKFIRSCIESLMAKLLSPVCFSSCLASTQ